MISSVFSKAEHKESEAVQRMQAKDKCGIFNVFENLAEESIVFAVFAKSHLLCVRTLSKQSTAFHVFWNSEGEISVHHCVSEGSAKQNIDFTMFAAAHPSKVQHLLSFETLKER